MSDANKIREVIEELRHMGFDVYVKELERLGFDPDTIDATINAALTPKEKPDNA